jgi:uncharacterized membrane protein
MPMTNPLYYEWLNAIARRDQAMLFIVLAALAGIGVWLVLREVRADRRIVVWVALYLFWASLVLVALQIR